MTHINTREQLRAAKEIKEIIEEMIHLMEQVRHLMESIPPIKERLETRNQYLVETALEMNYQLCALLVPKDAQHKQGE